MNTVCLATTLAQSPAFWSAGTELLRSKSRPGLLPTWDWFNAIDSSGSSTLRRGLPPASRNESS